MLNSGLVLLAVSSLGFGLSDSVAGARGSARYGARDSDGFFMWDFIGKPSILVGYRQVSWATWDQWEFQDSKMVSRIQLMEVR
jgi:hypothetical protein